METGRANDSFHDFDNLMTYQIVIGNEVVKLLLLLIVPLIISWHGPFRYGSGRAGTDRSGTGRAGRDGPGRGPGGARTGRDGPRRHEPGRAGKGQAEPIRVGPGPVGTSRVGTRRAGTSRKYLQTRIFAYYIYAGISPSRSDGLSLVDNKNVHERTAIRVQY